RLADEGGPAHFLARREAAPVGKPPEAREGGAGEPNRGDGGVGALSRRRPRGTPGRLAPGRARKGQRGPRSRHGPTASSPSGRHAPPPDKAGDIGTQLRTVRR